MKIVKAGYVFDWNEKGLTVNISFEDDAVPFAAHTIAEPTQEELLAFIDRYVAENSTDAKNEPKKKRVLTLSTDSERYDELMDILGNSKIPIEFIEDHEEDASI